MQEVGNNISYMNTIQYLLLYLLLCPTTIQYLILDMIMKLYSELLDVVIF